MVKHNYSVDSDIRQKWNDLTESIAELFEFPAVLVMHLNEDDIEVYATTHSEVNPYHIGDHEHFENSGLYCEWVINHQKPLMVENALKSCDWSNNPDIKLNMVSYLGFPVNYPDGTPFGTFCVLDNKEHHYSERIQQFLQRNAHIIEDHLLLIKQRNDLIKMIHGIIPMCASCKKVRNDNNEWDVIEKYIQQHSDANISHGICPDCLARLYPDLKTSTH